jgi:NADH-quinone oxidoreductase subunit C
MEKLTESKIAELVKAKFAEVEWIAPEAGVAYLVVPPAKTAEVAQFLRDEPALAFDYAVNLSALDNKEQIEVTYHFYSYKHRHSFAMKAKVAREGGAVASVAGLYGAANFMEREVYDHFGVKFTGHPNLIRILLPQDWVGYPLLKDYQEQEDYNGIGTTRPSLL